MAPETRDDEGGRAAESPAQLVEQLRSTDLEMARAAYIQLWTVNKDWVPQLLEQVANAAPTRLTSLRVVAFDKIGQPGADGELVYYVPGLGGTLIDDISGGIARHRQHYDVRIKQKRGFPVGVVVRAGLLNRFRSKDYPSGDDRADPKRWWIQYYARVRDSL